jgi:hypothetical protein
MPSTVNTTATAEKTTPGTPTKAGSLATVRTLGTKGTPAAAEMLATSGTHSKAGTEATAMMQASTAMQRVAEIPETVLMPTTLEFSQKITKKSSEWRNFTKKSENRPFFVRQVSACPIAIELSEVQFYWSDI